MKNRFFCASRWALVVLCSSYLSACEGDRALIFARDEVRPLSEKYSEASLSSRWALAFESALMEVHSRLDLISTTVSDVTREQEKQVEAVQWRQSEASDSDQDLRFLMEQGQRNGQVAELHSRVQSVHQGLERLSTYCCANPRFDRTHQCSWFNDRQRGCSRWKTGSR
jgi:hypothetical protein